MLPSISQEIFREAYVTWSLLLAFGKLCNTTKDLHEQIMCFLPIRLLSAMDTTLSLEKVPSAFSLFEHYADSPGQSSQHSLQHVAGKKLYILSSQKLTFWKYFGNFSKLKIESI